MHAINWFEIPSHDFDRAVRFYETLLGVTLHREVFFGVPNAIFPGAPSEVRGAVVFDERQRPAAGGAVLYLHTPDLETTLPRTEAAGGRVVLGKTNLGPIGFIAMIEDTEGNKIGLHMPASSP
jgi:hypothetical protein